jgi:hypothetical protein
MASYPGHHAARSGVLKGFVTPGIDTLHGGADGFDRRVWTVAKQTAHSVTFTLIDPNGMQGFPGTVHTTVSVSVRLCAWKVVDIRPGHLYARESLNMAYQDACNCRQIDADHALGSPLLEP